MNYVLLCFHTLFIAIDQLINCSKPFKLFKDLSLAVFVNFNQLHVFSPFKSVWNRVLFNHFTLSDWSWENKGEKKMAYSNDDQKEYRQNIIKLISPTWHHMSKVTPICLMNGKPPRQTCVYLSSSLRGQDRSILYSNLCRTCQDTPLWGGRSAIMVNSWIRRLLFSTTRIQNSWKYSE